MLTEKDYCDNETCVALTELGFTLDMTEKVYERNLMTNRYETIPKPLLYEAQKFLREEKQIEVVILSRGMVGAPYYFQVYTEDFVVIDDKEYSTYEGALSEGLRAAVEILKEK